MKLQVIVRLDDGIRNFWANTVAEANRICGYFKVQGIYAFVAPLYPEQEDTDD